MKRTFQRSGIRLQLARNNMDRMSVFLMPAGESPVNHYHTKRLARSLAKSLRAAAAQVEQWSGKVGT